MKSHNFEFLRPRASTLVDIAALAEKYWHSDPESCAVKLRAFAEHVVEGLYDIQRASSGRTPRVAGKATAAVIHPHWDRSTTRAGVRPRPESGPRSMWQPSYW
jgi:hypothetical protein